MIHVVGVFVEFGQFVIETRLGESPASRQRVLMEIDAGKAHVGTGKSGGHHLDRIARRILGIMSLHARTVRPLLSVSGAGERRMEGREDKSE